MDSKTATLLGAAVALAAGLALAETAAETPAAPVASSYAELLTPIPNAVERLKLSDAYWQAQQPKLIPVQYAADHHHHHHHHHHHSRRWYLRNGYTFNNGIWALLPRPHHHHHHHHHHN